MGKHDAWHTTIVTRKLDRLVWNFPYTDETKKEIESLLETLETSKKYYELKMDNIPEYNAFWSQRLASININLEYYRRNYEYRQR